ncbi:MAG: hypothetical protein NT075_27620 [Chloroflexi bacterium]|nr:hypothetical protein [Chloroflexota bacterium]
MTALTLVSTGNRPIRTLIEALLTNEYEELQVGIQKTEARIRYFENKYAMATAVFLERFAQDEFLHSFDFDEWIGESRLLQHMREKAETLRSIKIAN